MVLCLGRFRMKIIFAKTRYSYDSYTDFWNLVSFSNFPVCYIDEMDLPNPNHIYVTCPMNGELRSWNDETRARKRAKVYLWDLERPSGSGGLQNYINDNNKLIEEGFLDNILVSDKRLSQDTGFRYIPLGSHPDLGHPGGLSEKRYDVVHLMSYTGRRSDSWYKDPGITVAPNGWGDVKDASLKTARLMINIHQDAMKFIEPLRFALAAAYGLPIITESCLSIYPYDTTRAVIQCERESMLQTIHMVLKNYTELYYAGLVLRDRFTRNVTFRSCLERHL